MATNDAVKALHRLGRREFRHGNWDAGVKCFSSVSHPSIRATLEECLDAQVELAKLLLHHKESIESECPTVIQRVCDILNTAELQISSLLDPLNAPLTDDLVDRVILEGKLYYYQHQAWKELDNEKLATLALTKGYQSSRKFLSRIVDQQDSQANIERVRLWTVCLLTELVDFLDTRSKLDEAYDILKNETLATTDVLLCAKGLHIGIRIGTDKPEISDTLLLLQRMAANTSPEQDYLTAYAKNIGLLARLDIGDYAGVLSSEPPPSDAQLSVSEDDDRSDATVVNSVLNLLARSYCLYVRGKVSDSRESCTQALKASEDMVKAQKPFGPQLYQAALETRTQIDLARNDIESAASDLLYAVQNSRGNSSFRVHYLLAMYFYTIGKTEEAIECCQMAANSQSSELKDASILYQALLMCDSDTDNSGYNARSKIDEMPQTAARSSLLSLVKELVSVIVEYNLAVSASQSADKSLVDRLERIQEANNASFESQQIDGISMYLLGCLYHQWGAMDKAETFYKRAMAAGDTVADDFLLKAIVNQTTSIYQEQGDIEKEMANFNLQQTYTERIMDNAMVSQSDPVHIQIQEKWRNLRDTS